MDGPVWQWESPVGTRTEARDQLDPLEVVMGKLVLSQLLVIMNIVPDLLQVSGATSGLDPFVQRHQRSPVGAPVSALGTAQQSADRSFIVVLGFDEPAAIEIKV